MAEGPVAALNGGLSEGRHVGDEDESKATVRVSLRQRHLSSTTESKQVSNQLDSFCEYFAARRL